MKDLKLEDGGSAGMSVHVCC